MDLDYTPTRANLSLHPGGCTFSLSRVFWVYMGCASVQGSSCGGDHVVPLRVPARALEEDHGEYEKS